MMTPFAPARPQALAILVKLGVSPDAFAEGGLPARSPITGETIATVRETTPEGASEIIARAHDAFLRARPLAAAPRAHRSDARKARMWRTTNTVDYGNTLPLAQGVKFDIDA